MPLEAAELVKRRLAANIAGETVLAALERAGELVVVLSRPESGLGVVGKAPRPRNEFGPRAVDGLRVVVVCAFARCRWLAKLRGAGVVFICALIIGGVDLINEGNVGFGFEAGRGCKARPPARDGKRRAKRSSLNFVRFGSSSSGSGSPSPGLLAPGCAAPSTGCEEATSDFASLKLSPACAAGADS